MPSKNHNHSIRALGGQPGGPYDEETFLHLLTLERARAERANERLRLLLVTIEPAAGRPVTIAEASGVRIVDGLKLLLRDTDVVGWYERGRVVGAVLGVLSDEVGSEASSVIEQRVGDGLRKRLPARIAVSLRVRVTQHGPRRVAKA
jgi:hypothetical protein